MERSGMSASPHECNQNLASQNVSARDSAAGVIPHSLLPRKQCSVSFPSLAEAFDFTGSIPAFEKNQVISGG
jgi:hypothetical protein